MLCLYKGGTAFLVIPENKDKYNGEIAYEQLQFIMCKIADGYKAFHPAFNDPTILFTLSACLKGIDVEDIDRQIERTWYEIDLSQYNILVGEIKKEETDSKGALWFSFKCLREYEFCIIEETKAK